MNEIKDLRVNYKGQLYRRIAIKPHIRADGTETQLATKALPDLRGAVHHHHGAPAQVASAVMTLSATSVAGAAGVFEGGFSPKLWGRSTANRLTDHDGTAMAMAARRANEAKELAQLIIGSSEGPGCCG